MVIQTLIWHKPGLLYGDDDFLTISLTMALQFMGLGFNSVSTVKNF